MYRNIRQVLLIFILSLAIVISWSQVEDYRNNRRDEFNYNSQLKLSNLPDDWRQGVALLEKLAGEKKEALNQQGFYLDILPLSGDRYLTEKTPLVLQTYYTQSQKMIEKVTSMPASFVGLSSRELESISGNWRIKTYRPGSALILYREVDDYTPEDKENVHLGIVEDRVAIFYGHSGTVFNKTAIKLKELPLAQQQELAEGIRVENPGEELPSILEGLISIKQD